MEKILSQQEIDDMVRAARGGATAPLAGASFSRWDYRQAGRLGRDQMVTISALHDGFARAVTHSIGAYLRTAFQVSMASAEHLTCGEFLSGIPELTYLAFCKVAPFNASGLIQLDLGIAFALIDMLLGGEGSSQPPSRDITEIEEQVAETAMRIVPGGSRRFISPRAVPAAVIVSCTSSAAAAGMFSSPPSCMGNDAEAACDITVQMASVHSCTKALTGPSDGMVGLLIPPSSRSALQRRKQSVRRAFGPRGRHLP